MIPAFNPALNKAPVTVRSVTAVAGSAKRVTSRVRLLPMMLLPQPQSANDPTPWCPTLRHDLHLPRSKAFGLRRCVYLPTPKLVLQTGVGVAFGGALKLGGGTYHFSPGPTALIGADYRAFDDGRYFLLLTSGLSFAMARTQLGTEASAGYEAFDLRLGTQFGVQLARVLRPYATARIFGGPVYWRYGGRTVTGTDTHHYQLGAGVGLRVSRTLLVFAEGIPLGERAVSLGVGLAL